MSFEVKEEIIGSIVVVAVILAGTLGAYIVLKPAGQAYQLPVDVCSCSLDGYWEQVMYNDEFVFLGDGSSRYIGPVPSGEEKCAVICANIGGFA